MNSNNTSKIWVIMATILTMLLSSCVPSTPPPPTVTASSVPTPTHTATPQPTKTAIQTATSTPLPELATPRWMILGQPGYNVEIFDETWFYYKDNWGESHACINYQHNDYERYFQQCFAIIDEDVPTLTFDGVLDPMLENGFEEISPRTEFANIDRASLSALKKEERVILFQLIEAEPYLYLVEMSVTVTDIPLQDIYETYAADIMDYALLDALQKSKIAPAPAPTPMSPEQQSNYDDHNDLLISEAEVNELYSPGRFEHLSDYVTKYRICRDFEDRTNADVLWVSMANCVQVTTPDVTMEEIKEFYTQEDDVFPDSKYAAENYLVFGYGQGHLYYYAVTFGDGLAFVSIIETRSLVGTTLENGFTENIDDFLHAVLMENLKKFE